MTSHEALIHLYRAEQFLFIAFGEDISKWPPSVLEAYKVFDTYHVPHAGLDTHRALFYLENVI